jgi:hypothetical protein
MIAAFRDSNMPALIAKGNIACPRWEFEVLLAGQQLFSLLAE